MNVPKRSRRSAGKRRNGSPCHAEPRAGLEWSWGVKPARHTALRRQRGGGRKKCIHLVFVKTKWRLFISSLIGTKPWFCKCFPKSNLFGFQPAVARDLDNVVNTCQLQASESCTSHQMLALKEQVADSFLIHHTWRSHSLLMVAHPFCSFPALS